MNITGAEGLLFGVDDLEESRRFLTIYGLSEIRADASGASFRALDGSGVELRLIDDPDLPPAPTPGPTLRACIWGVKAQADLDAIADELSRDRQVRRLDGQVCSTDDDGNAIYFRVSVRTPYEAEHPACNVAGHPAKRFNTRVDFDTHGPALQMGHIVYWSPDPGRSMAFYRDRLDFRITDSFASNGGVFGRAPGHSDHHSIFFIGNPSVPPGFQHAEFTFGDVQDVFAGGHKLAKAGYETAYGPGRFELGSNWYWYFKTPMGGAFELGADMDQVDDAWTPKEFQDARAAGGWALGFAMERSRP